MGENVIRCSDPTVELAGAPELSELKSPWEEQLPAALAATPGRWTMRSGHTELTVWTGGLSHRALQGQEPSEWLHRVGTHGSRVLKN